jgi:hypothetical protein
MSKCFYDGQRILYKINNHKWIGYYCKTTNSIVYNKEHYKTLLAFSNFHYLNINSTRHSNGWNECFYEKKPNIWYKTKYL